MSGALKVATSRCVPACAKTPAFVLARAFADGADVAAVSARSSVIPARTSSCRGSFASRAGAQELAIALAPVGGSDRAIVGAATIAFAANQESQVVEKQTSCVKLLLVVWRVERSA
jgi:hypothetical protein